MHGSQGELREPGAAEKPLEGPPRQVSTSHAPWPGSLLMIPPHQHHAEARAAAEPHRWPYWVLPVEVPLKRYVQVLTLQYLQM